MNLKYGDKVYVHDGKFFFNVKGTVINFELGFDMETPSRYLVLFDETKDKEWIAVNLINKEPKK